MLTKSNLLDDHENWLEHVEHMKEAAAGAPRQADLHEVGFVDPSELPVARKQTTEARAERGHAHGALTACEESQTRS